MSGDTILGPGGEFDLVRTMQGVWGGRARGIGDDAAVLQAGMGESIIVSTDLSVEFVHFRRDWLTPEEIGYRATASALSDLAAMAARPIGLLVALTLPEEWRPATASLAAGIGSAAEQSGAPIVGGDISRGERLSLAVTVVGAASAPVGRSGMRSGDLVYVTGRLGAPACALRALQSGRVPDAVIRDRFARPTPRIRESMALGARGVSAMIDISDGLASELRHLASASGVAVEVDLSRLPIMHGCSLEDATRGGEEYELVVSASSPLDVTAFTAEFALPLTCIGRAIGPTGDIRPGEVLADLAGRRVDLGAGHDHFSR